MRRWKQSCEARVNQAFQGLPSRGGVLIGFFAAKPTSMAWMQT